MNQSVSEILQNCATVSISRFIGLVNVKLFVTYHAMKMHKRVEVMFHVYLT